MAEATGVLAHGSQHADTTQALWKGQQHVALWKFSFLLFLCTFLFCPPRRHVHYLDSSQCGLQMCFQCDSSLGFILERRSQSNLCISQRSGLKRRKSNRKPDGNLPTEPQMTATPRLSSPRTRSSNLIPSIKCASREFSGCKPFPSSMWLTIF